MPPIETRSVDARACPFAIGRGPDNDWVLEDPDRHISKVHCRIEVFGDGLSLVDMSSNGVFFASESRPIGRGKRRPLDPGDSFRIGDYRIAVGREAADTLPSVVQGSDSVSEAVVGVADILSGTNEGIEHRAARSVTGSAGEWLGGLPHGAVDEQIVQPLGWDSPPATALTDLPEDLAQPLSEFASLSEHVPAVNGALQVGGAKAILPTDWNIYDEATSGSAIEADATGGTGWHAAQTAILEGAALTGLMPEAAMVRGERDALVRTGQIMRRLVDALAAIEAVQRTTEHDLGLADDAGPASDLPSLLAAAIWAADEASTGSLIQRVAGIAQHMRALGLSVVETADEVGAQIQPDALEAAAREEARLAVGPLLRAASWERYCAVHANLSGAPDAPAADAVLAPLRRVFSQRA